MIGRLRSSWSLLWHRGEPAPDLADCGGMSYDPSARRLARSHCAIDEAFIVHVIGIAGTPL